MTPRVVSRLAAAALAIALAACATNPPAAPVPGAPKYPAYTQPDIPAALRVTTDVRDRHELAWRRLQAGDLRGATREFTDLLKSSAGFYPADAGLGFVALADRQPKAAVTHFTAALAKNARYLSALDGLAEAHLTLRDDAGAVAALEQILKVDPSRDAVRSRLEVLRLRVVQAHIDAARRARDAGRLDEAQTGLERALDVMPANAVILRELTLVETARGALDAAEAHGKRSVQLDAGDAEAQAALAAVFEAKGRYRDAADAFARAVAIDPRPAWREHSDSLRAKAIAAAIPPEYRAIPAAATVTRAQVAAMIGLRLDAVLSRSTRKVPAVATDIRGDWASSWIVRVTQAGVMDVFPNHTFQPAAIVRRADLAHVVSQLLVLAASRRPDELARWRSARPRFTDLAAGHVSYPTAALAVASGAMTAEGDRFSPTRAASGADLVAAIARIEQIAGR